MNKTKILQGLNLLSENSIVEIQLQKTDDILRILNKIANIHPLFIHKYKFINNDILQIETPIPFLYKEASKELIALSNNKISYEACEKYIIETLIKQRISGMSTIPVLYYTQKLKYEITPTIIEKDIVANEDTAYTKSFNKFYTLGCGKGSQFTQSIASTKDSSMGKGIQRDKWSTNLMISRLKLPIPQWDTLDNKDQIEKIWKKYNKPVVIKPTGLTGGNGVALNIKTLEEAKEAYDFAKKAINTKQRQDWQKKIMIQEQVKGEDYRLLVINGKLEITTKRIPAFITGDGEKTIEQLIEETNKDPRRDITNPSHTLKPITIDEPLLKYIKEQKLTLKDIPQEGEKIQLRKVASMSQGGITEDCTDKVSNEIKYIAESIATSIHAFTLGVDVLCKDISKPLTIENGAILEVNTMPESYLNFYPVLGESREYIAEKYVQELLDNNKTKRIVVIGNTQTDIPTLLRERNIIGKSYIAKEEIIGEYKNGDITINGLDINKNIEKQEAIGALKVNALLDTIIINHRNWKEVEETGLGFNKIDLLLVTKEQAENKEYMSIVKKYRFKKLISKIKTI